MDDPNLIIIEEWDYESPFNKALEQKLNNYINKYSKAINSPDIFNERKNDLKNIIRKLVYQSSEKYRFTGSGALLSYNYWDERGHYEGYANGRPYEVILEELFLLPNLFLDVLKLTEISWREKVAKFQGGHLPQIIIELYYRVFERHDAKKRDEEGAPGWNKIFNAISKRKNNYGESILSSKAIIREYTKYSKRNWKYSKEINIENQMRAFYKFKESNKLSSLEDYKKYLKSKGYPPIQFFHFT
jgi:hypothetical protein